VPITVEQPDHKVSVAIREFALRRLAGVAAKPGGAHRRPRRLWARSRREAQ
jgi:hypothetical protein